MRHYCTYFDHNYLARGLALHQSLLRYSPKFVFWVLCLSEEARLALGKLALPGIEIIRLEDFERGNPALAQAKSNRSLVEYYFTCTPLLPHYIFQARPEVDCLSYIDSDMYFFDDPEKIFAEIGPNSVAITPHRFPPPLQWKERLGRFNVGWLTFRRDEQGLACLDSWGKQCLEWCYDREENGRFADQKYLDEWPARFRGVKVLDHPGINAAPWNLARARLTEDDSCVQINGSPLILFHFHKLRQIAPCIYDPQWADYQVRPNAILRRRIYAPYIELLEKLKNDTAELVGGIGAKTASDLRRPGDSERSPLRRAWRASPWRRCWYALLAWGGVLRRRHFLVCSGRVRM